MPRPAAGRRTDSLFDNRYRYDHIYPRGRSGETLRAYDTLDADRPVVIKRPAPQDAPPMRAGQEVSILNERRALEKLAGHPVLTELRHSGTFRVGGQTHQYIVVDLAEGVTVEDYTLDLASRGERLPLLETLVILDGLLDLLETAHARKIVYNDVDAKHLFWDRAHYRLKVIDWGNAVFLEGDNPHITRAADVYQAAELLYFILSGGRRLEINRTAAEPALDLPEGTPSRLRSVLTRATLPDPAARYPDISSLRRDLSEVRRPLEKAREAAVERVRAELPRTTTQDGLESLGAALHETLAGDPGYPPATLLLADVETRLTQLSIQGDLDAARIYIESGATGRATALLNDVLARAGDPQKPLLLFLLDVAAQLEQDALSRPAAGLAPALDALYRGDPQSAGRALITTPEVRPEAHTQQLLLAERLTLRMPEVALLRPHLARIDQALSGRTGDRAALMRLTAPLDNVTERGVQPLRAVYVTLAAALPAFAAKLTQQDAAEAARRAEQAAAEIADLLDLVGRSVLNDSGRANDALWRPGAIDPTNPAFETLNTTLSAFYSAWETTAQSTLAANSQEAALGWLVETRARMIGYLDDLPDPRLRDLLNGLDTAIADWHTAADSFASGGRRPAVDAYQRAAEAVQPLNETVARWFSDHARSVSEARFVESLCPNVALGAALAEGWEAWDRGRIIEARAAAARAGQLAKTEGEATAALRLDQLAEVAGAWLAAEGATNHAATEAAAAASAALLTADEDQIWRTFAAQMPNSSIFLKAMARGLVEPLRDMSSAAARALFLHFTLRGILALLDDQAAELAFNKEAASKILPNVRLHPAYLALEDTITRRQLLMTAVEALNSVTRVGDLPAARPAVRAPLAAAQLDPAEQGLRALDDAIRRWADGDFRAARGHIETAAERITAGEKAINQYLGGRHTLSIGHFLEWLGELGAVAEELQNARRAIEQAALVPADRPDPAIETAHRRIANLTEGTLGEDYAGLLRGWRDTYINMRQTYEDMALTKAEKLRLFEGYFASLFIERHPAFPIYRHWQSVITLEPDPQPSFVGSGLSSYAPTFEDDLHARRAAASGEIVAPPELPYTDPIVAPSGEMVAPPPESRFPWLIGLAVIGVVVIVGAVALLALSGRTPPPPPALTISPIPGIAAAGTRASAIAVLGPATGIASATHSATPSITPTEVPTDTPTSTPIPPTPTPTPIQLVPTETHPVTPSPTVPTSVATTAAPAPVTATSNGTTFPTDVPAGDYDMLAALTALDPNSYTWPSDLFSNVAGKGWQLGTTNGKVGGANQIVKIGPSTLAALYGTQASRHITRLQVTFELTAYDKTLVPTGGVYFGLGFDTPQGQRAAAQIKLSAITPQAISEGTNFNGKFTPRTLVGTGTLKITLAARRNTDSTVSVYADGQLLGTTTATIYGPATPVSIVFYTSGPSVIVTVSAISVHIG